MTDGLSTPLIVYIPNYPYVTLSNFSTFQLSTNDSQRDAVIRNGGLTATMNNNTRLSTCFGCAILSRSLEKTGTPVPDVCTSCFTDYCWNGTLDSRTPASYEPTTELQALKLSAGSRLGSGSVWVSVVVAVVVAVMIL